MNVKEQIISTLRDTGREGIEKVISYMERNGFFSVGCHHHHRYKGGLADHAWQTYLLALKGEEEYNKRFPSASSFNKTNIAISALLHDFCDCHGMHHIHNHGRRSARMLKELGFHLSSDEFFAIRFHMSLKNKKNHPLYEKAKHCHLRSIVHQADVQSAKRYRGFSV